MTRYLVRRLGFWLQRLGERLWDWGMEPIYREQGLR